jgi:hypothetical protein
MPDIMALSRAAAPSSSSAAADRALPAARSGSGCHGGSGSASRGSPVTAGSACSSAPSRQGHGVLVGGLVIVGGDHHRLRELVGDPR